MKIQFFLSLIVLMLFVKSSLSQDVCSYNKTNNLISKYKEMKKVYEDIQQIYIENIVILQNNITAAQKTESQLRRELKIEELNLNNTKESHSLVKEKLLQTESKLKASEITIDNLSLHLKNNISVLDNKTKEVSSKTEEIIKLNQIIQEQKQNISQLQDLQTQLKTYNEIAKKNNEELVALKTERASNIDMIKELNAKILSFEACGKSHSCMAFGNSNSIQTIQVTGLKTFEVLCNSKLAGPGWTVIQQRLNGSVNFYRNWEEYKNGFGELSGEFFIGLEKLYRMTKAEPTELYIYMEDFKGETRYIKYDHFEIGSEEESYYLKSLGSHQGDIENQLENNVGQKFSTFDRDNEEYEGNCAENLEGGWWYSNSCGLTNLNGLYQIADIDYDTIDRAIFWDSDWHTIEYSLKTVIMMIREKSASAKVSN